MIDLTGQMITTHQKADIAGKMMLNCVKTKQEIQQTMVWAVGLTIVQTQDVVQINHHKPYIVLMPHLQL